MLNLMLMATKSTRPRKGATRKAPPPPKRQVPVWMWLAVPLLVAGFVFVLVKLADVESQAPQPTLVQPVKPAPAQIKPKVVETPKPAPKAAENKKETFEFYQILQDSEVDTSHVDAYQYEPRGEQDFYYMIQAASFRSNADADRLRAKLILSGLEAKIKSSESKEGKVWYRVIVGPFDTRSGESRAQDKLAAMGINSYTYKVKKEQ